MAMARMVDFLLPIKIVLLPLLSVTKNGIRITYSYDQDGGIKEKEVWEFCQRQTSAGGRKAQMLVLPLNASVAPGAWFLSGWNFKASFL